MVSRLLIVFECESSLDVSKMVQTKIAKLYDKPAETLALSNSDESSENEESSSRRQTHGNNSQRKSDNLSNSSKKCDHLFDSYFEESKPDIDLEDELRSLRNQLRNIDTVMAEKNAMIAEKDVIIAELNRRNSGLQDKLLQRLDDMESRCFYLLLDVLTVFNVH